MTAVLLFALGVVAASLAGFLSPCWFLGFLPLSAGLIWAAYGLDFGQEVASGPPPPPSR